MTAPAPGPLAGTVVVEMAAIGPVPHCGLVLAEMGAGVIRLDRVGASDLGIPVPPRHDALARGKRSVTLDLKSPDGLAAARTLIARADVLLEGIPTRRHGAAGPGTRPLPRRQPAPGVRADERLGRCRADGGGQRA